MKRHIAALALATAALPAAATDVDPCRLLTPAEIAAALGAQAAEGKRSSIDARAAAASRRTGACPARPVGAQP